MLNDTEMRSIDASKRHAKAVFATICGLGFLYILLTVADVTRIIGDNVTDSAKLVIIIFLCLVALRSGRAFLEVTNTRKIFLVAMALLILIHITELTEEFEFFYGVPLLGKTTKAKRIYETGLMCGTVCSFLGGIYLSLFEINNARKKLSEAVDKLSEDQKKLKSLASQLALAEERERHRLATVLHDRVGQSLVFSKLKLDEICRSASCKNLEKALEEVCNYISKTIEDTRTLTFDLSSPILYELGFEAAVSEWLKDEIEQKYGIPTEFESDQKPKVLDEDIQVVLFRNVRELLTNVVKHSQAQKVKISISRVDGDIHVSVKDDGKGFDPVEVTSMAAKRAEFGLFSIREQLSQLGGSVDIASQPGRGARIVMTAPLKKTITADAAQNV